MTAELDALEAGGIPPESGGGPGAPAPLRPLPRQTGALHAEALGRDRLGVRLVATHRPPAGPRPERPDRGAGG